ncbi:MAG: hypothetical protein JST30_08955 [Armatimonadetes bacterium]|nr:hypothetical protein [Armatimonadota bacterium]
MSFGLASFGLFAIVALGVLLFLVIALVAALRSAGSKSSGQTGLGEEARWLLRPIRQLRDGLDDLSRRAKAPEVKIIAAEAVSEADAVLEHAMRLVEARESLKRGLKGRGEAETNYNRLQRQYVEAASDSERSALESAMEARSRELQSYDAAQAKVKEIDGKLREAEATLSELKARLSAGAVHSGTQWEEAEFGDVVSRLKGLGRSFDEVQAELEVTS